MEKTSRIFFFIVDFAVTFFHVVTTWLTGVTHFFQTYIFFLLIKRNFSNFLSLSLSHRNKLVSNCFEYSSFLKKYKNVIKKKKKKKENGRNLTTRFRIAEEIIFWSSHRRFFSSYLVAERANSRPRIVARFSKCFCSYVQARTSCLERRRGSHL